MDRTWRSSCFFRPPERGIPAIGTYRPGGGVGFVVHGCGIPATERKFKMSEKPPLPETHFGQAPEREEEELACRYCHSRIYDAYFEVSGEISCQKCRYTVEEQRLSGSGAVRFVRAALAGSVAAVALIVNLLFL